MATNDEIVEDHKEDEGDEGYRGTGNMIVTGYAWIKGKNRTYQQSLTAATTTSTTATLRGR